MFATIILWSLASIGTLSIVAWICGWITITITDKGKKQVEETKKTIKDKVK